MTARGVDVEKPVDDPGAGWFGMARPTGERTVTDGPAEQSAGTDRRSIRDAAPESWESRLASSGAWDFTVRSGRARHRSKVLLLVAAMIGVSALAVGMFSLFAGTSAVTESPTVAPTAPPSFAKSAPVVVRQSPAPPPAPSGSPPPSPPSAEQMKPLPNRQYYPPTSQAPDEPRKPQTDVTRAPMSASPPVVSKIPERNSSTPGDARRHGLFG